MSEWTKECGEWTLQVWFISWALFFQEYRTKDKKNIRALFKHGKGFLANITKQKATSKEVQCIFFFLIITINLGKITSNKFIMKAINLTLPLPYFCVPQRCFFLLFPIIHSIVVKNHLFDNKNVCIFFYK